MRGECNPSAQWFYDKVIAVELAASPRIVNLAHTHYGSSGYFGETQATADRDFTKRLFVSSQEHGRDGHFELPRAGPPCVTQ